MPHGPRQKEAFDRLAAAMRKMEEASKEASQAMLDLSWGVQQADGLIDALQELTGSVNAENPYLGCAAAVSLMKSALKKEK